MQPESSEQSNGESTSARWLYRSSAVRYGLVGLCLVVCVLVVWTFGVDAGGAQPDPVSFDQTKTIGLTMETQLTYRDRDISVPRVQVFYSQYSYVVGYEGVERAVQTLSSPPHRAQFGVPLTIYVSDYSDTGVDVTEDGSLRTVREPEWVTADGAFFVVGSSAQTTAGETVVPFGARSVAESFANSHGGSVVTWSALKSHNVTLDDATVVRDRVADDRQSADETVAAVDGLTARPQQVVVGKDVPTVQGAIDAAPPNSTVVVPEGTYDEHITIDKPITLRGENATLRGNSTGTVVEVTHDRAAIDGVTIMGVGTETQPENVSGQGVGDWGARVDAAYGHTDAGVRVNASRVAVYDVTIETPTTGVLVRDSTAVVVDGLTLAGTETPMDGFMGVLSIRSPVVVQNSWFDGGRDGIYLHRADGTVIRNNSFFGQRFGVHLMYTSESLIADNVARNQETSGIVIMTNPTRNAVVGNDIRDANYGIMASGSRSYIADNVVAYNEWGMTVSAQQSLYERNVIYGNDVGVRSDTILPSNRVRRNDFVANRRHAVAGIGPLRIWTDGETGNYWEGAYGFSTEPTIARSYSPTHPLERRFHRTDGAITLSASPGARALAAIRDTSPGLRRGNIVDTAPLTRPVRPDVITAVSRNETASPRSDEQSGGETDG